MRPPIATSVPILLSFLAAAATGPTEAAGAGLWGSGKTVLRAVDAVYIIEDARGERTVKLPPAVEVEELFELRGGAFLSARAPASTDGSAQGSARGSERRDLFLAWIDGQGLRPLPSPAVAEEEGGGRVRENAVPLASAAGELAGLAWLEGSDRQSYAVRVSDWDGMRWSEPRTVAPAAAGSQLALSGTTLADGSKLLVWSRFDGQDDEVVAARFADGSWGPVVALDADNAVPDITPALVAVPGGALAAWSRYDGHDYRVVLSRFDGEKWSVPAWAGPAGSTSPQLTRSEPDGVAGAAGPRKAASAWLTFASARPRGWSVVELDRAGGELRRGRVEEAPAARPALVRLASGEVRLRWAAGERNVELK